MPYVGKKATNVVDVSETQSLTVDGDLTISDKIVHSGDTDTAIRFPSADTVTVEIGGSERLKVASAGFLDLGTTTDAATVSSTATDYQLQLGSAQSTTGDIGRNISFDFSGTTTAAINTVDGGSGLAQSLAFYTHNASSLNEAMRIDPSGNIGLGTTPASGVRLDIRNDSTTNIADLRNANSAGFGLYVAGGTGSSYYAFRAADKDNAALFTVNGDGNVLVGGTTYSGAGLSLAKPDSSGVFSIFSGAGTGFQMRFGNVTNGVVGSISTTTSSTAFSTSSDYRLKENVTGITDGITRVKQLNPSRFNFKADADTKVDGFLAHEAQTVVPEAVTGTKDETRSVSNVVLSADGKILARDVLQSDWTAGKLPTTDTDGNKVDALYPSDSTWAASHTEPMYQGIDQAKLVPVLTAALQEAIAKIEALETKVAALEG